MILNELFENESPRIIVTYPGRFQPFHQGHHAVFKILQQHFGVNNVYILTSDKTDTKKSPFNFQDKLVLMTTAGVPQDKIIETSNMYSLPEEFNASETIFIAAVGAPDADRLRPDTLTVKDSTDKYGNFKPAGSPGYYKSWTGQNAVTANKHGYVIIIPEIEKNIKLNGQTYDVSHGTECRELWNTIRNDKNLKKNFLTQLYGEFNPILEKIFDKIPYTQPRNEDLSPMGQSSVSPISGNVHEEAAGVGVIASNKQRKNPKYSTSLTKDVKPGAIQRSLRGFRLAENKDEAKFIASPNLISAIRDVESGNNPNAVSPKGAMGTMQVMPNTAKNPGFGVAPARDTSQQELERVGTDYFNAMLRKYEGDTQKALIAYNMGPTATDKWVARGANPRLLPAETQNYVPKVLGTYSNLNKPDTQSSKTINVQPVNTVKNQQSFATANRSQSIIPTQPASLVTTKDYDFRGPTGKVSLNVNPKWTAPAGPKLEPQPDTVALNQLIAQKNRPESIDQIINKQTNVVNRPESIDQIIGTQSAVTQPIKTSTSVPMPNTVPSKPASQARPQKQTKVREAWSKKYKKSINCSNPKGFSQKAHCAGRKARQSGKKTKSSKLYETITIKNFMGQLEHLLKIAMSELNLAVLPSIKLHKRIQAHDGQATFGRYLNNSNVIHIALEGRHPIDIFRTLAHEIVHFKQNLEKKLDQNSGDTGSPEENEANAIAGKIMRIFNKTFPQSINSKPFMF